jgi:hypothetical protein
MQNDPVLKDEFERKEFEKKYIFIDTQITKNEIIVTLKDNAGELFCGAVFGESDVINFSHSCFVLFNAGAGHVSSYARLSRADPSP